GGLLQTFERPSGVVSTMSYNGAGELISDESSAGSSSTLARSYTSSGWTITNTSDLGFALSHAVTTNDSNKYKRVSTSASGLIETYEENFSSKVTSYSTNANYGTQNTSQNGPRFGEALR